VKAFYKLEAGLLPGTKIGKTTVRRLRDRILGETAA
jgi:hypothetical protein